MLGAQFVHLELGAEVGDLRLHHGKGEGFLDPEALAAAGGAADQRVLGKLRWLGAPRSAGTNRLPPDAGHGLIEQTYSVEVDLRHGILIEMG